MQVLYCVETLFIFACSVIPFQDIIRTTRFTYFLPLKITKINAQRTSKYSPSTQSLVLKSEGKLIASSNVLWVTFILLILFIILFLILLYFLPSLIDFFPYTSDDPSEHFHILLTRFLLLNLLQCWSYFCKCVCTVGVHCIFVGH